ncbi:MAG: hypothetical protein ASUL_09649 [Candidatus Aramenus sulfurataquae]|jgi:hypothetical protein|uniref:Uncharacterized protein n=2 Tax=Candidatus Aramenus sulfurataquae TaxID=1326980 RepID=W7KT94_9CREN|nr:MAG: hypothetical protein ASUL_09649 [Candidatus Aramenus sulfurataquae]MCL7344573.1 hypothetical protein [Candidatus Aramenus sulfurataquae]
MNGKLKIRLEVVIFTAILLSALLVWLFYPLWILRSANYAQYITPLGFEIYFFGSDFLLISPLMITSLIFFAFSAIIPIVWRSSRYSLYSSSFSLLLGFVMIINALIFEQRYLNFHGYSVILTPTGSFYIYFPYSTYFSVPFYLILASAAISTLNSLTRARWIPYNRPTLLDKLNRDIMSKGIIGAFSEWFERIGIPYAAESNKLMVKDLTLSTEDRGRELSVFFPNGEIIVFGKRGVLYIAKDGEIKYMNLDDGIKLTIAKALERAEINREIVEEKIYL